MVRPPMAFRFLYPGAVWNISTKEKIVYLTFDDGPIPEVTSKVLELLDQYHAKATFFCIGENVKKYPTIFSSLLASGHAIGNHTYHHYNSWKVRSGMYLKDVEEASKYISSTLFRPPYGKLKAGTFFSLRRKYTIIMWDVITCDFDVKVAKEKVFENVIMNAKEGSIIVFHDSKKASENMLYALPKVLAYYSEKGFRFEAIKS